MSHPEVAAILKELSVMKEGQEKLHETMGTIKVQNDEMYTIFSGAKSVSTVIKWLGSIAIAITSIILLAKNVK